MIVLFGLMSGLFLAAGDVTVVSTAMPNAVSSLGGTEIFSRVFTAYVIATMISGPIWGRVSELQGKRRIFAAGIALFLVGSALSGASINMLELVIFRTVQGLGAGALLILTLTIVGEVFPLEERARAQRYISSVWAIASITGPLIGGFITDTLSWRWVFYVNIPFGAMTVHVIWRYLREDAQRRDGRLDLPGTALFAVSSVALLTSLNDFIVIGGWTVLLIILTMTSFSLFVAIECRSQSPLILASVQGSIDCHFSHR